MVQVIFGDIIRHLTKTIDQFYSELDCTAKSTQKKVKVDLKHFDSQISGMNLDISQDILTVLKSKIQSLLI
jgi:hypothetical protein